MMDSRHLHKFRPEDLLNGDNAAGSAWAAALGRGDSAAARREFVRELREGPSRFVAGISIPHLYREAAGNVIGQTGGHAYRADDVVEHIYHGVYGIVHQFRDGIDWKLNPTDGMGEGRTAEWVVQMNRHYQWIALADAYRASADGKYARAWREELVTWAQQQPCPARANNAMSDGWRNIEVGIRASWTWPYAFDVFRHAPEVSDDDIWLFAETMFQHGDYVLQWPTTRNFKAMEGNGMAWVGLLFPEFYHAPTFLSTALDRAIAEMSRQFLPDGCQDELAPSYAWVSISNFYSTLMAVHEAVQRNPNNPGLHSRVALDIPLPVWQRFDSLIRAVECIATPAGRMPPLNDSPASRCDRWREVLKMPVEMERTAGGGSPTEWDVLPYGGYGVLKRGGEWALIDIGPHGTAHQHSDALQFLFFDEGADRLIDCNKPLYNASLRTKAIRSSLAHNVVLCNGLPHLPAPLVKKCSYPVPYAATDINGSRCIIAGRRFATASLDKDPAFQPTAFSWTRLVCRLAASGWLIVDWVQTNDSKPVNWEWAWHFNPRPAPQLHTPAAGRAEVHFADGYHLQVLSAATAPITSQWLSGVDEPQPRGWRVAVDQQYEEVPLLSVLAEPCVGGMAAATWFLPHSKDDSPSPPQLTLSARKSSWLIDAQQADHTTRLAVDGDPFSAVSLSLNGSTALEMTEYMGL